MTTDVTTTLIKEARIETRTERTSGARPPPSRFPQWTEGLTDELLSQSQGAERALSHSSGLLEGGFQLRVTAHEAVR